MEMMTYILIILILFIVYQVRFLSITLSNGGSGYTAPPSIIMTGGNGSGAVASCTISSGIVNAITVSNYGNGYTY